MFLIDGLIDLELLKQPNYATMTHNETRGHWIKEGAIGSTIGLLYGITYVGVSHPFDTSKT